MKPRFGSQAPSTHGSIPRDQTGALLKQHFFLAFSLTNVICIPRDQTGALLKREELDLRHQQLLKYS
ncbi:MAG: hypothetical protein LBM75_10785, partial [Myxococcales bacterium]|nr:hypothetical protein [Myxococcales bacterium]